MADDFDVEAMLEAPYRKEDDHVRTKERDRSRDRDRKKRSRSKDRKSSRDHDRHGRDKKRSRSKERERERDRGDRDRGDRDRGDRDKDRDRERDRDRDRDRDRERRRSKSKDRDRGEKKRDSHKKRRSRSRERYFHRGRSISPLRRNSYLDLTPEERDARTVFCMQMSARIRQRDLEEFFSSVGKVRDCRLISDNKTRRSKGIAYIEFGDVESVPLALGLTGQRLLGVPIIVQASQAERNRQAQAGQAEADKASAGPMRLYVGSLHFNITEEMLRGIFEPFGKIEHINLVMDNETGRSKGFGFVTFHNCDDAKKALDQLNGFELAGRPMKVGHVTERTADGQGGGALDNDEMDRAGVELGATGRLQLMAKLAEGTGFEIPQAAANALNMAPPGQTAATAAAAAAQPPPIATQCFMLSNMFEPNSETSPTWDTEIRDDVIEECNKHGGVLHIYVDKASPQGNVYVKCPSIAAAVASVAALHGRYFAGKVITAAYVPLPNYHALFPDAQRAIQLMLPSTHNLGHSAMSISGVPGVQYLQ